MKYISAIILIILMSWTWCLATNERPLGLEKHKQVEEGVSNDIREFIHKRYPSTSDIYCPQLYTELVAPTSDEMIARFRCHVVGAATDDEASEQIFEGFLKLKSTDGFATWTEVGGEIFAKEIRFLNGLKVTPQEAPPKTTDHE